MNKTGTALRITAIVVFIIAAITGVYFGVRNGFMHNPVGNGAGLPFYWSQALEIWCVGLFIGMFFLFLSENLALLNRIAVHAENAKPITADDVAKTQSNKTDL